MCVLEVFLEDVKMFTSVCLTFSISLSFFFFFLLFLSSSREAPDGSHGGSTGIVL